MITRLQETAQSAFNRATLYRSLYERVPEITSIDDFRSLPPLTQELIRASEATDLICLEDGQLVMELNPFSADQKGFPFTPLENEHDMDRRYRRITRILRLAGANSSRTAIVCDETTIYFAAEIERVLPWPIVIVFRSSRSETDLARDLDQIEAQTVLWASHFPVADLPKGCTSLLVFNSRGASTTEFSHTRVFNVLTLSLIPWLAVTTDYANYDTCDACEADDGTIEKQFYLEKDPRGTLLITSLQPCDEPGAISIVRFDTGIIVREIGETLFSAVPTNTSG